MKASALLLACALAAAGAANGRLVLVDQGKSQYSICVEGDASPSMRRGAAELQRFLEEMSGARLPLDCGGARRILLRASPRFGPEAFALRTEGNRLRIEGGAQRGVMYGVYTLLEKLGCRWFARDASRVPKTPTIALGPLDESHKPAFEYREVFVTEGFDKDWAARNKTNGNHSELDESTGGKVRYYPFVHSFYTLIPPEKYFKEHPEYFSLIDGQRRVERGQLCLTNPDVLRLGVERVLDWIRERPEVTIFSVSQNDWEGWCECDNCRRVEREEGGAHSGPLLRFVNALAAGIEQRHPDKLIDTLAYWYTEDPPSKVRPRPNVRIRLCPIGVCEAHPYGSCPRSAYFVKNLRAWAAITHQLYIWHYNTNFSHYLIPFPDFRQLADSIRLYQRSGVVGLFMEGSYPQGGGGENAELRSYVMARLLWNPALDADREIDDFMAGYYGKAATLMRAYFELLHRQGHHIWINPVPPYSEAFLNEAARLFDRAERAAEDQTVRRRVEKARLPIEYLEFLRARRYAVEGEWYRPDSLPGLKDRFTTLLTRLRGFGVQSIHEGRNLDADEAEFAAYMKPYRVTTIENDRLRADLAPELSGRIIRLIDRRAGRDLLRRVDTGERSYPDQGGIAVFAYPDFHGRPFEVKWESEPGGLRGVSANGLVLRRRLELRGGVLETHAEAENRGSQPLEVVLQARGEFDPGDIDQASVAFFSQAGEAVTRRLIRPLEPPLGSETWQERAQPQGSWGLAGVVSNTFLPAEVERTHLNWTAKGHPRVTLALWSRKVKLAPGQKLALASHYEATTPAGAR